MKTETPTPTNPAAFPMEISEHGEEWQDGMTLRDVFACFALLSIPRSGERSPYELAKLAFEVADSMLRAREP